MFIKNDNFKRKKIQKNHCNNMLGGLTLLFVNTILTYWCAHCLSASQFPFSFVDVNLRRGFWLVQFESPYCRSKPLFLYIQHSYEHLPLEILREVLQAKRQAHRTL